MITNLFSAARTALTGLAIFGFASAAVAGTSVHEHHVTLAEAVRDAGVRLYINPDKCNEIPAMGWYSGNGPVMVICQENHGPDTVEDQVAWTEEDYDTLRHEAQHLLQDCTDGVLDHQLQNVFSDPRGFATVVIGQPRVDRIGFVYTQRGATPHVLNLEYEAFSVAALNVPLVQAEDINRLFS